jgi:ribose transport system ATP-binding protein
MAATATIEAVDRSSPALRIEGVHKRFGATCAVSDVSLEIVPGEIRALVGGNGCGKSTLVKILAGVHRADAGVLETDGATHSLDQFTPALARKHCMHFVHQQSTTFKDLTVAENLMIGYGFETGRLGQIKRRAMLERAARVLERYEIDVDPARVLGELRPATQTMVEIARALQDQDERRRGILVLDEPTAALPPQEVELLLGAVRRYAALGQTILFISHRLDEVLRIADTITAMRDGRHVATVRRSEIDHDGLVELIVGRKVERHVTAPRSGAQADAVVECRGLAGGGLRGLDVDVGPGEIVGIAGQIGSGRSSLLRILFGDEPMSAGTVTLAGNPFAPRRPSDAMAAGVAYVPEDRPEQALLAELSVAENLTAATVGRYWRGGYLHRRGERAEARSDVERFLVRTATIDAPIAALSGGNQQKVVLARWMRRSPRLLLLDEPTQGVDIGARSEIWSLVRGAALAGAATIVVLSDFEELVASCHRVLALRNGRLLAELSGSQLTVDHLNNVLHTEEVAA